jgi:hypothetical protein
MSQVLLKIWSEEHDSVYLHVVDQERKLIMADNPLGSTKMP